MMYLAVSYDHRIVDGKEAVSFLVRVKEGGGRPPPAAAGSVAATKFTMAHSYSTPMAAMSRPYAATLRTE